MTSHLHQYSPKFEFEPCDLKISQFCYDMDPFCARFLSILLHHVDIEVGYLILILNDVSFEREVKTNVGLLSYDLFHISFKYLGSTCFGLNNTHGHTHGRLTR